MREILYVQAGTLANYIGTHFWNTQESYFTYSDDEESLVDHDISFREGETSKGDSTYCPRLITFDRKANFGTLARTGIFSEKNDYIPDSQLWQGAISEHEYKPIEPHAYQTHLQADHNELDLSSASREPVRYWSDFNRTFYIPRTMQMLPDVPDWQNTEGDWAFGQETFERFNEETELMEGSVRLFMEECNSFQGLQLMMDTSTFGAFSHSFLIAFYDEVSRAPCLSFPLMGDVVPRNANPENTVHMRKVVNDAVCLRELGNLSLSTVPTLNPATWSPGAWNTNLRIDNGYYHTSSILSAHIESSTFPLRLKESQDSISSFSKHLNFHGSHRFSQLSGVFPVACATTPQHISQQLYNFSSVTQDPLRTTYHTRRDVTRGFSTSALEAYEAWFRTQSIKEPFVISKHTQAYPLPSSFPDIFCDESIVSDHRSRMTRIDSTKLPSMSMFTSLNTNTDTSEMFVAYANFIQTCIDRRKTGILTGLIETLDDMKELANDLWTIHDGYSEYSSDELDAEES